MLQKMNQEIVNAMKTSILMLINAYKPQHAMTTYKLDLMQI